MKRSTDEKAKALRREYYRKWRAANRDKVRQYDLNYWKRKAQSKQNQKEGE